MEIKNNNEKRVVYSFLAIFLIIGVFIAFAGYQYHKNFKKHFKTNVERQLGIIADLKVGEIEHWMEEQRGSADAMFTNKVFSNLIKRHLNNPNDSVIKSEIQSWLKEFQTAFNYNAIILTDPQLVKKIIVPEKPERPQAYISPGNIDSLNAGEIIFEDFYRDDLKQKIFLKLLVPILDVKKLIAIIELRIDPKTYLYPMLENWPLVSETSETIILRREGNEVVYLNELRFQKNSALNFRVSLEQTNVPVVKAVLGHEGFMEGIGYNGNEVVAHINKIPHSPWYLITKTDASEAYANLRKNLWLTVVFSFGIFLTSGMSLGFLWRNQRTLIYKERIKSAEALQKLNLAIFNSHDVVFSTDKEGIITYINPQFTNIYGYTAEEVVGVMTPRILNSGIYKREDHKSLWDALLNKQSVPKTEYLNKCKDGKLIEIEGSANPIINNNGDLIGFLGIQRDITDRKKAEKEIKLKNDQLQTINAEKDKFISILAHDLRGPMSTFIAITQLLTEEIQMMTPDQVKDITTSMNKDASNIYKLLENLIEWSRLKRGVIDFKPGKLNLIKTISTTIEPISASALKKEIIINMSIPDDLDVIADKYMLETVIRNLISNAVKFTPVGGKICVNAYINQKNQIEIKISDTGIGMDPDLKSKLFLLNENTGRKGTEGEPSFGLGLLLCKEFVEKQSGKIWMESEEGKGSDFIVTLPIFLE